MPPLTVAGNTMIDIRDLREHPERYRQAVRDKRLEADVDPVLRLDGQWREAVAERESLAAEKNRIGKAIGELAGRLKAAAPEAREALEAQMAELKAQPAALKERERELEARIQALEAERHARLLELPQPAETHVPVGAGEAENVEIRRWAPPDFDVERPFEAHRGFPWRDHVELAEAHGWLHLERGVRMAGSRSWMLTGDGMRLHQALLRFGFDFMTEEIGFTPVAVPVLVREAMMEGTGFFPHGRAQAYEVANPTGEGHGLFLTGTGEVGLMGMHAGEILDPQSLPRCYTTLSTCFRREAGSAGKDTAGLFRVHQFEKVEQVVILRADREASRAWHTRMIGYVETLLQRLELPYRLLQCCTGDIGVKNADMIDLECWIPSRGEGGAWGETHSASMLYDYQCRRVGTRYRDPESGENVYCHSLNNTVVASPRLLIPLLEIHQQADGSIRVPEALRPYLGGRERIGG